MKNGDYQRIYRELVLNWKLRLVVSALFSILGLSVLISFTSGYVMEEFKVLDQTIVGVAVFVIVIPIYLIVADLPKIDEYTIAEMLNREIPELGGNAELVLESPSDLDEEEKRARDKIESVFEDSKLYRHLPNRPIKQAVFLMGLCLVLTAGVYLYFQ